MEREREKKGKEGKREGGRKEGTKEVRGRRKGQWVGVERGEMVQSVKYLLVQTRGPKFTSWHPYKKLDPVVHTCNV